MHCLLIKRTKCTITAHLPVWLVIDVYNGNTLYFAAWMPYLCHITLCASACLINMLKQVWSSYCKMVIKDMAYAGLACSLSAHHLRRKNIEHLVESGRNVMVTSFHKLAGGRVGWQEVATYLIRSSYCGLSIKTKLLKMNIHPYITVHCITHNTWFKKGINVQLSATA